MDQIKQVMKRAGITSLIILVYGLIIREKAVYIGMFLGSLVSILCFYMIYLEAITTSVRGASIGGSVIGYLKRYVIYGGILWGAVYFYGLPMLISTAVGLLNIKFNIVLLALNKIFIKLKKKYLN